MRDQLDSEGLWVQRENENVKAYGQAIAGKPITPEQWQDYQQRVAELQRRSAGWQGLNAQYQGLPAATVPKVQPVQYHPPPEEAKLAAIEPALAKRGHAPSTLPVIAGLKQQYGATHAALAGTFAARKAQLDADAKRLAAEDKQLAEIGKRLQAGELSPATEGPYLAALRQHQMNVGAYRGTAEVLKNQVNRYNAFLKKYQNEDLHLGMVYPEEVGGPGPSAGQRAFQAVDNFFQPITAQAERNLPAARRGLMMAGQYPDLPDLPRNLPPDQKAALIRQKNDLLALVERDTRGGPLELNPLTGGMQPRASHLNEAALTPFQRQILPIIRKQFAAEAKAREIAGVEKAGLVDAAAVAVGMLLGGAVGGKVTASLSARLAPLLLPELATGAELLGPKAAARLFAARVIPSIAGTAAGYGTAGSAGGLIAGAAYGPPKFDKKTGKPIPPTPLERATYGLETGAKSFLPSAAIGAGVGLAGELVVSGLARLGWRPLPPGAGPAAGGGKGQPPAGPLFYDPDSGATVRRIGLPRGGWDVEVVEPGTYAAEETPGRRYRIPQVMTDGLRPVPASGEVPPPRVPGGPAPEPGAPSPEQGQPLTEDQKITADRLIRQAGPPVAGPEGSPQTGGPPTAVMEPPGVAAPGQEPPVAPPPSETTPPPPFDSTPVTPRLPPGPEDLAALENELQAREIQLRQAQSSGDQLAESQLRAQVVSLTNQIDDLRGLLSGQLTFTPGSGGGGMRTAAGAPEGPRVPFVTPAGLTVDLRTRPLPDLFGFRDQLAALHAQGQLTPAQQVGYGRLQKFLDGVQQREAFETVPPVSEEAKAAISNELLNPTRRRVNGLDAFDQGIRAAEARGDHETAAILADARTTLQRTLAQTINRHYADPGAPLPPPVPPLLAAPVRRLTPVQFGRLPAATRLSLLLQDLTNSSHVFDPTALPFVERPRNLRNERQLQTIADEQYGLAGRFLGNLFAPAVETVPSGPTQLPGTTTGTPPAPEATTGPTGPSSPTGSTLSPTEPSPLTPPLPSTGGAAPAGSGATLGGSIPVTPENLRAGAKVRSIGTGIAYELEGPGEEAGRWAGRVTFKPELSRVPVEVGQVRQLPESSLLDPARFDYHGNDRPLPAAPPATGTEPSAPAGEPSTPAETTPPVSPPSGSTSPVSSPPSEPRPEPKATPAAPPASGAPPSTSERPPSALATSPPSTTATTTPPTERAPELPAPVARLIDALLERINARMTADEPVFLNNPELEAFAQPILQGSRAAGTYDAQTVYNALEAAVNRYVVQQQFGQQEAKAALDHVADLQQALPTQTIRAGDKDALQQFSTPPTLALVAAYALQAKPGESLLEPSAGTGSLLAMAESLYAGSPREYHANEIDDERRAILDEYFTSRTFAVDARYLNAMLPHDLSFDLILMNPPFSAAQTQRAQNTNEIGFDHVAQALKRLKPGGRLVAILGRGAALDRPTAGKFWQRVAGEYTLRANIGLPGAEYRKYGTSFATQLVIIDNAGPTDPNAMIWTEAVTSPAAAIEGLYEHGILERAAGEGRAPSLGAGPAGATGERGAAGGATSPGRRGSGGRPEPGGREGVAGPPEPGAPGEAVSAGVAGPAAGERGAGGEPGGGGAAAGALPRTRPGARGAGNQPDRQLEDPAWLLRQDSLIRNRATGEEFRVTAGWGPGDHAGAESLADDREITIGAAGTEYQPEEFELVKPGPLYPDEVKPGALLEHPTVGDVVRVLDVRHDDTLPRSQQDQVQIEYVQVPHPDGIQRGDRTVVPMTRLLDYYLPYRPTEGGLPLEARTPRVAPRPPAGPAPAPAPAPTPAPAPKKKPPKAKAAAPAAGQPATRQDVGTQYVTFQAPYVLEGRPHPAVMVETRSLAAVDPPAIRVTHHLKEETLYPTAALAKDYAKRTGRPEPDPNSLGISQLQLEEVLYAQQRWELILPDGARAGYFTGGGTGLGKGRMLAAMAANAWEMGGRRIYWLSASANLINNARDDLAAIGYGDIPVKKLNDFPGGEPIPDSFEGIIFSTYATLIKAAEQGSLKDQPRRYQIERWLAGGSAADHEGDRGEQALILMDEGHFMKNAIEVGRGKPSKSAIQGMKLQQNLKRARVAYASATGMTDIDNMAYLTRLGMWGPGTPWAGGFRDFASEMGDRSKMEMIARDMKARGAYLAREQSYEDPEGRPEQSVEIRSLRHELTGEDERNYNLVADAWQIVLQNMNAALEITGNVQEAKKNAMTAFWGQHQQFFRRFLTALKLPTLYQDIDEQLAAGRSVIISLIGTGAESVGRAVGEAIRNDGDLDDLDLTPIQALVRLVERSFPSRLYVEEIGPDGKTTIMMAAEDADGNPVHDPDALALKERLLERLSAITERLPGNPLDEILFRYEHGNVAEMTSREHRLEPGKEGKLEYKRRGGSPTSVAEMERFNRGEKRIAVISTSASIGISLHAGLQFGNQQRRVQYMLELSWSADKQMQSNGRSHRTNQASAPIFVPVSTNAGGEVRFAASIARRLASMGALTRGSAEATGAGGALDQYDYENPYGRAALSSLYGHIERGGSVPNLANPMQALRDMGVLGTSQAGLVAVPDEERENIPHFFNRLLALHVDQQNPLFDAFDRLFQRRVENAKASGEFDFGVQDIRGENIREAAPPRVVYTDPTTGAEATYHHVVADVPTHPVTLKDLDRLEAAERQGYFRRNSDQKLVYMARSDHPVSPNRVITPTNWWSSSISSADLARNFTRLPDNEQIGARRLWSEEVAKVPPFTARHYHILSGSLMGVWDRIRAAAQEHIDMRRALLPDGTRIVGVALAANRYRPVLRQLGASTEGVSAADLYTRVLEGGEEIELTSGLSLSRGRVGGRPVVQINGLEYAVRADLARQGFPEERIGATYRYRMWIPADPDSGPVMLGLLLQRFPPVETGTAMPAPAQAAVPSPRRRGLAVVPPTQIPLFGVPEGGIPFPTLRWLEQASAGLSVQFQRLAADGLEPDAAERAHDFGVLLWPELVTPEGPAFLGGLSAPVYGPDGEEAGRAVYVNPFPPLYGAGGVYQGLKENPDPGSVADQILTSMIHELAHQNVEEEGGPLLEAISAIEERLGPERLKEARDGIERLIAGDNGKLTPGYLAARRGYYGRARLDRRPPPTLGAEGAPDRGRALGQTIGGGGPEQPETPGRYGRQPQGAGAAALKAAAREIDREAEQIEALDYEWAQEAGRRMRKEAGDLRQLARPVPAGADPALTSEIERLQAAAVATYGAAAAHKAARKGLRPGDFHAYTARSEEIQQQATAARTALKEAWENLARPMRARTPPTTVKEQFLKEAAAHRPEWRPAAVPVGRDPQLWTPDAFVGHWTDLDQTPTVRRNLARVAGAMTGQPLDLVGFRHEHGGRVPATGVYYATSPGIARGYAPPATQREQPLGKTIGPLRSLTIDRLSFDNPLVVNGGHYGLAQALDTLPFTAANRQAIRYAWRKLAMSMDDAWYIPMDKAIAKAVTDAGFDALLYRKTDLKPYRDWMTGKTYWDQRRNESVIVDLRPAVMRPAPKILYQIVPSGPPPEPTGPREGPGHRTEPAKLPDEGLEAQVVEAALPKPPPYEVFRQAAASFPGLFLRVWPFLPANDPAYAELSYRFTHLDKAWGMANMNAVLNLVRIYGELNKNDQSLYRRVLISLDMEEEVGEQLRRLVERFGDETPLEKLVPLIALPQGDGTPQQRWTPARAARMADWARTELAKPENQAVAEALDIRKLVFNAVLDRLSAAQKAVSGRPLVLNRREWFHHMINDFAESERHKRLGYAGRVQPRTLPFTLRREGSLLNYNTEDIAVELGWLPGALYQTYTLEFLAWVQDRFDVKKELQKAALAINLDRLFDILEAAAEAINAKRTRGEPVTAEDLYRRQYNRPIAEGFWRLGWLCRNHPDWLPGHDDERWEDLIEQMARNFDLREDAAAIQSADPQIDVEARGKFFEWLTWLLTPPQAGQAGSGAAAQIFKGIRARAQKIKHTLGLEHVTWRDLLHQKIGDIDFTGYRGWQPDEKSAFYGAWAVRDRVAQAVLEAENSGTGLSLNLTPEDLRRVKVLGGRKPEWVLPHAVADQLDNFKNPYQVHHPILAAGAKLSSGWKQWTLINPLHYVGYNVRNEITDAEMIAYNPHVKAYIKPAARMLTDFMWRKQLPAADLQEWLDWGGQTSTLQASEAGATSGHLDMLSHLNDSQPNLLQRIMNAARVSTDWREAILRFAMYMSYRDQMLADPEGKPPNYGASDRRAIDAIQNLRLRAWAISNDLMGPYDRVPQGYKLVRTVIPAPFLNWKIINTRRQLNLINNEIFEKFADWLVMRMPLTAPGGGALPPAKPPLPPTGGGGPGGEGESEDEARRRNLQNLLGLRAEAKRRGLNWRWVVSKLPWASPMLVYWIFRYLVKSQIVNALEAGWNWALFRDEEEHLPPWVRYRPHIDLGHLFGGKSFAYIDRTSGVGDAAAGFGVDNIPQYWQQVRAGRMSVWEVMRDLLVQGPGQELYNQVGLPRAAMEFLTRRKLFPSLDQPREITDRWQYVFDQLSLGKVYQTLRPNIPHHLGKLAVVGQMLGLSFFHPGETAYGEARETADNWAKDHGFGDQAVSSGPETDRQSMAYWAKRAAKVGDDAALHHFLVMYWQLGGTDATFNDSVKHTYPLFNWPKKQRKEFLQSLDQGEQQRWRDMLWFLQQAYVPKMKTSQAEMDRYGHAPIDQFDHWLWHRIESGLNSQHRFKGFERTEPAAAKAKQERKELIGR